MKRSPPDMIAAQGFSVIELVVGATIFSVVVATSLGLFGTVLQSQRSAFAIQDLQSNARFALEIMAKEIRTGKSFSVFGGTRIEFTNSDALNVVYRLNGTRLERSDDGGTNFLPITSDEVQILSLAFRLPAGGPNQEKVTMMMRMQGAGARPEEKFIIELQTTVSQRLLEI